MRRLCAQLLLRLAVLLLGACIVVIVTAHTQQPHDWLAFSRYLQDGNYTLQIMDVPRRLTHRLGRTWFTTADEFTWSQDGRLAFRTMDLRDSTTSEILIFDTNTVTFTDPIARSGGLERYPAWSPDGRLTFVAYYDDNRMNIYLLDAAEVTQITTNEHGGGLMPVWSQDGQLAFAYAESSTNFDIAIYNPADGSWRPVEHPQDGATNPSWSATGLLALRVYDNNPPTPSTLMIYDGVAMLEIGQVTTFQPVSWSANGQLAYIAGPSNELTIYDTRTRTTSVIAGTFGASTPNWSPAGDLLYKREGNGSYDFYVLNLTDNTRVNLTNSPDYEYFAVWMP